MSESGIASFFECRRCVTGGRRSKLHVGLANEWTIRIWCAACNTRVGDFVLAERRTLRCDVCGEEIGPGHRH